MKWEVGKDRLVILAFKALVRRGSRQTYSMLNFVLWIDFSLV